MDVLLPAMYSVLSGDATLGTLTSQINQFRQPEDPAKLEGKLPVVVFTARDLSDAAGLHGAALNAEIEVSVWAYGASGYKKAVKAAQRVAEVMLQGLTLSDGSGHTRWGEVLGWRQIDQPNPNTVLYRCEYRSRYWSMGRVNALVTAAS